MLQAFANQLQTLMGYDRDVGDVGVLQMALRTVLIYAFSLFLIRIGSKRFLNQSSAFDVIVGIMLGSVMSRAINGSAPFWPTLGAGLVLIGLHWLLGVLSYHLDWFGPFVKGNPVLLIKDGKPQLGGLRRTATSSGDLAEALRLQAQETDPSKIQLATMERNGAISVLPEKAPPRVLDVKVEDGVQTVRIKLE